MCLWVHDDPLVGTKLLTVVFSGAPVDVGLDEDKSLKQDLVTICDNSAAIFLYFLYLQKRQVTLDRKHLSAD